MTDDELREKLFALWRAGRDSDDRYLAVDELEEYLVARDAAKEQEGWLHGRLDTLNELDLELFFKTTNPEGHFIKERLNKKIDATVDVIRNIERPKSDLVGRQEDE